jgi:hypothetical protein
MLTKARCGAPAKTTSAGSSPTVSVAVTFPAARSTMPTLSETRFDPASPFVRARTVNGRARPGSGHVHWQRAAEREELEPVVGSADDEERRAVRRRRPGAPAGSPS